MLTGRGYVLATDVREHGERNPRANVQTEGRRKTVIEAVRPNRFPQSRFVGLLESDGFLSKCERTCACVISPFGKLAKERYEQSAILIRAALAWGLAVV